MNPLDEIKSSALKEMANVGISHVATAIGEIAKEKVEISLPELQEFTPERFVVSDNNIQDHVCAYLTVEGISQLSETLIVLSKKDAYNLMNKFVNFDMNEPVKTTELSTEALKSVFSEVSTIIASTYFSAVDTMFSLKTNCSVPKVSFGEFQLTDFLRGILKNKNGIVIKTSFISQESKLKGVFAFITEPSSLDEFFRNIGLMV